MALLLFLGFLALPLLEIYIILQVGGLIGTWPTVTLLVADSVLGAWIVRHEGLRAWRRLQETITSGVMPDRELADAALILVGGTLLLTPGFVTDALGFVAVLPFTRPLVRGALAGLARRRLVAHVGAYSANGRPGGSQQAHDPYGSHRVVRGDVVDDDST